MYQLLDMIAIVGNMIEIRPFEVARGGDIEKQASYVGVSVAGRGNEPTQPVDELEVFVLLDGNESRAYQRGAIMHTGFETIR